jgi:hypothetical protein
VRPPEILFFAEKSPAGSVAVSVIVTAVPGSNDVTFFGELSNCANHGATVDTEQRG